MGAPGDTPRNLLVEQHLPLVRRIASRYVARDEDLDDLVQVGSVALVVAADRFDRARGVPFAAYAEPCVCGAIKRHLRDRSATVRVPRRAYQEHLSVREAEADLTRRLGRAPTTGEVASRTGRSTSDVQTCRVPPGATTSLASVAPAALTVTPWEATDDRLSVSIALDRLNGKVGQAIRWRFFNDLNQSEIAERLGVSQVQVSRLLNRGLARLRDELDDRLVASKTTRA